MNSTSENPTATATKPIAVAADSPATEDSATRPYVPDRQAPPRKEGASVLLGGVGILAVILLLALLRIGHPQTSATKASVLQTKKMAQPTQSTESRVPIIDDNRPDPQSGDHSQLDSDDIARTATRRPETVAANLGAIPPFDSQQNWEPPSYQQSTQTMDSNDGNQEPPEDKNEKQSLEKASLVFVRNSQQSVVTHERSDVPVDFGIGLPSGTKLRARIEAAVSTAVQTPVLAVIEYNYERNGEMVIPAGAKAFGHLEAADATGYVNVRFDSLLMPDGSSVTIEGAATDLRLRPVKGKVEGKHAGKNILVRSVAGLGEITATLAGRGSLDQPLSEGDLIRERAANNIAQASDQQLSSLAVTQHIVVTVPANTEIYVVLGKPARVTDGNPLRSPLTNVASTPSNAEQLRQLLELQRELNQQTDTVAKQ